MDEVVIVGGGPVGMLLAAEVGRAGVSATVVEALGETHDEPRAGTLHARTVQSLVRRGYLEAPARADAASEKVVRTPFHLAGHPMLTLESPAAEGPPMVGLSQAEIERFFEQQARAAGVRVLRGRRVTGLEPGGGRVRVRVRTDAGDDLVAAHVVGCDGARSTVRRLAGFASTTHPATFAGILGLVRLTDPSSVPGGWTHGPTGSVLANPNPGGESRVLTHSYGDPLPERGEPVALPELRDAASRILGHDVGMDSASYLGRFSDWSRLADTYRLGPCLLAGDAAHVHAPLGGQGLNTGLQDALNLGWKLALVAAGGAPDRLLDTYDTERRPVAARVIANTRAQAALMRPGDAFEPLRDMVTDLLADPGANRRLSDLVSGQGVRHGRPGELTGAFLPNAPVGDTTLAELLRGTRPVLLAAGGAVDPSAVAAWSDRIDVVSVEHLPYAEPIVLCRPDGYVAWAGSDTGRLARALEEWLGVPVT